MHNRWNPESPIALADLRTLKRHGVKWGLILLIGFEINTCYYYRSVLSEVRPVTVSVAVITNGQPKLSLVPPAELVVTRYFFMKLLMA